MTQTQLFLGSSKLGALSSRVINKGYIICIFIILLFSCFSIFSTLQQQTPSGLILQVASVDFEAARRPNHQKVMGKRDGQKGSSPPASGCPRFAWKWHLHMMLGEPTVSFGGEFWNETTTHLPNVGVPNLDPCSKMTRFVPSVGLHLSETNRRRLKGERSSPASRPKHGLNDLNGPQLWDQNSWASGAISGFLNLFGCRIWVLPRMVPKAQVAEVVKMGNKQSSSHGEK